MEGQLEPRKDRPGSDRAHLRISDGDRHRVAEILREAAGEGRLDWAELDQRLEAAYAAKTYADLVPITEDLPVPGRSPAPERTEPARVETGQRTERHVAVLGGFERKGAWTVPQLLKVTAVLGGASLDLRRATFSAREVVFELNAFMGGAEIVVGPHTHVVMEGTGILGGYEGPVDKVPAEFDDSSPTLRIRGRAVMGGVSVVRKAAPGDDGRRLPRRRDSRP